MSNWIDFDMLMLELDFFRNNAQRRISEYKKMENPLELDTHQYHEAVGEEVVLMCIQAWCKHFNFSSDEVMDIINKEK